MKQVFTRISFCIAVALGGAFSTSWAQEPAIEIDRIAPFGAVVQSTAILDDAGEPLGPDTYDTGLDALKAGNFAAFLAGETLAASEGDAESDLSFIALAIDAYLQGNPKYADFFDSISDGSRDSHFADKVKAWLILLDGEENEAIAALSKANGNRISITEELSLAVMLEGMGRTDQALAVYSTLIPNEIETPKNDFDIQNLRLEQYRTIIARQASLFRQLDRIDEAKAAYQILVQADPENAARYKGYIADINSKSPTDSEPLTPVTAMSLAINDMAAMDYRNRILASNQMGRRLTEFDMRYAIFLQMALMLAPEDENRWLSVANQLTDKRLFDGAAHVLNASKLTTPWVNLTLAETQLKLLDTDGARKALKTALTDVEEDEKRTVFAMAMNLYASLGDARATRSLAYKYISLIDEAHNKPAAYSTLAYAYRDIGLYKKAVAYMKRAVELDDSHPRRMALWTMLGEAGQVDAAEKGLRSEFLTRLDDPYMLNGLGYFLVTYTDKLEEGYRLLMKADSLVSDNPFITDSLGWALFKLGHIDRAKSLIERSRAVYLPNLHWEVEDHLGDIYWHLGDEEAAKTYWQNSLEQYPPSIDRVRIAKKLKTGLKDAKPETVDLPRVNLDERVEDDKDI